MKAFDKTGKLVEVEITGETRRFFRDGVEVAYKDLTVDEQNRMDGRIDALYDLPFFDEDEGYVSSGPSRHLEARQAAKLLPAE